MSASYEGFSPASQAAVGETGLTGEEEQESSPSLKRKKTPVNMRESLKRNDTNYTSNPQAGTLFCV